MVSGLAVAAAFVALFPPMALRYTDGIAIERSVDVVALVALVAMGVVAAALSRWRVVAFVAAVTLALLAALVAAGVSLPVSFVYRWVLSSITHPGLWLVTGALAGGALLGWDRPARSRGGGEPSTSEASSVSADGR